MYLTTFQVYAKSSKALQLYTSKLICLIKKMAEDKVNDEATENKLNISLNLNHPKCCSM